MSIRRWGKAIAPLPSRNRNGQVISGKGLNYGDNVILYEKNDKLDDVFASAHIQTN